MKKVLSIVIPTYNMEEWLPRCLDSLTNDPAILDSLEVLVINDGSKDKSLEIAQEYASKYPGTIIPIDKPNGNYGSCVNKGLKEATGKYFRILDADDWVDTTGLKDLIALCKTVDVDAIFTHYTVEMPYENKHFDHQIKARPLNMAIDVSNFQNIRYFQAWDEDLAMHKLTYKTEHLRTINFRHTEGISYTDTEYVFYPICRIKSLYFLDTYLYKYFVGRDGQTVSVSSKLKTIGHLRLIIDRMLEYNLDSIPNDTQKNWCLEYLTFVVASYYHRILVIQKLTKENSLFLRALDDDIKRKYEVLYSALDQVNVKGVKWIKIWRKYNFQIVKPGIYALLTKYLKKY